MSSKNNNYAVSTVTVNTGGVTLLERKTNRTALILGNQGAEDVQLRLDDDTTSYIILAAGDTMHMPGAPLNKITAATDANTSDVTVWEA